MYDFKTGTVSVDSIGDRKQVEVMSVASGLWCQCRSVMTSYPLSLILFIAEKKGVHLVCEEIRRHEDKSYIKEFFDKEVFSFLPRQEWNDEDVVLDFGCGAGSSSLILSDEIPCLKIHGVDNDPVQVEVATKRAEELGYDNVKFELSRDPFYVPNQYYDKIVLSAVLEHLTPEERSVIIFELYERLNPGGVIFINQTPHRYYPIETHTTGLPLINYLPDSLAFWYARFFSRRKPCKCAWQDMLKMGIRGSTESEVISIIEQKPNKDRHIELLSLSEKSGYNHIMELWKEGPQYRNHAFLKKMIYYPTLAMHKITGKAFLPYIFLAIRKPFSGS